MYIYKLYLLYFFDKKIMKLFIDEIKTFLFFKSIFFVIISLLFLIAIHNAT
jgi:hypothetical protein